MSKLPDIMPGHWDTRDGAEMARCYAGRTRRELFGGQFTDMGVAYATAMISRSDADFEASLAVARDRIRWLSVHLAIANEHLAEVTTERDALADHLLEMDEQA